MIIKWLLTPLLVGLAVTLAAGAPVIGALRRMKARQIISLDAPTKHQSKAGTPTMGGLVILLGVVAAVLTFTWMQRSPGALAVGREGSLALPVLGATLLFGAIGLLDDLLIICRGRSLGLKAREKLLLQFLVAIACVWWFHTVLRPPVMSVTTQEQWQVWGRQLFQVLLLVGMSNATNLTDGLDGLLAGVSLPIFLTLGFIAWSGLGAKPEYGVMALCMGFAGATLGYLWYNAHPAQVFMGDTGSLAIGGALAAAAIALGLEWVLLIAALVPIIEAGSVVLQVVSFKTTGQRIFKMSPLHHHFELIGWPETRIVARFTIVSAGCSILALLTLALVASR